MADACKRVSTLTVVSRLSCPFIHSFEQNAGPVRMSLYQVERTGRILAEPCDGSDIPDTLGVFEVPQKDWKRDTPGRADRRCGFAGCSPQCTVVFRKNAIKRWLEESGPIRGQVSQ
jgi:hypothetical protein